MGSLNQLRLLLWKNWILKKRHYVNTLIQLVIPLLMTLLLVFVRMKVQPPMFIKEPTMFDKFGVFDGNPLTGNATRLLSNDYLAVGIDLQAAELRLGTGPVKIAYSPDDKWTRDIVANIRKVLPRLVFVGVPDPDDVAKFMSANEIDKGIVFNNVVTDQDIPKKIGYTLRFRTEDALFNWETDKDYPDMVFPGPRDPHSIYGGQPGYVLHGFIALQHATALGIIRTINSTADVDSVVATMQRFPYPPYEMDAFTMVLQMFFSLILIFTFIFPAVNLVKNLVLEKEKKLKESMKIMGMEGWMHWVSWYITTLVIFGIVIVTMCILFKLDVGGGSRVLGNTDFSVMFVFLFLYISATILFCFAASVFFSRANMAAGVIGFIWILAFIPYFFIQPQYVNYSCCQKLLACLLSNSAGALGGHIIGLFEGMGVGVHWSNIAVSPAASDSFSMLHVMLMLLFDCFFYGFITWYINAVFPGEFGVPEKWFFCFEKTYWFGTKQFKGNHMTGVLNQANQRGSFFENDPTGMEAGVEINGLTKVFDNQTAVNDLYVKMFNGQITVLLGHNGAGKTTTISMLTGLFAPTYGNAYINGYDIVSNVRQARQSVGICPQHDVLYDDLTVEEHLLFYCRLKGYPMEHIDSEINRILNSVSLAHKRNALSSTLSGGLKRRLSVGIALSGDSKVVMLDEPTSGMDPSARREIWDLLQNEKRHRTILLTTHFMEEADYLGDRIAIMAKGKLQCCGSPLFLKKKYGAGYHMTVVKQPSCDWRLVDQLIKSHVPSAHVENHVAAELSYILPHDQIDRFESMFNEMETRKVELGVDGYGASITTMEEVFLKVGEETDEDIKEFMTKDHSSNESTGDLIRICDDATLDHLSLDKMEGNGLLCQQLKAMIIKKLLHIRRNWTLTLTQAVLPFVLIGLFLIAVKNSGGGELGFPSRPMNTKNFEPTLIPYAVTESSISAVNRLATAFASQFQGTPGTARLVGSNVSDYIVQESTAKLDYVMAHMMIGAQIGVVDGTKPELTVMFNNQPLHIVSAALTTMDSALIRYFTDKDISFEVTNYPLPFTNMQKIETPPAQPSAFAIYVMMSLSALAASFLLFVVRERVSNSKQQQLVSGLRLPVFWFAHFVVDYVNYIIPMFLVIFLFAVSGVEDLNSCRFLGGLTVVLLVFGVNVLPMMYLFSFLFTSPSTGFTRMSLFNLLTGMICMMTLSILFIDALGMRSLAEKLEWLFLIFPGHNLGWSAYELLTNFQLEKNCAALNITTVCSSAYHNPCCPMNCGAAVCPAYTDSLLSFRRPGVGRMLLAMLLSAGFYFALVFLAEYRILQSFSSTFSRIVYRRGINGYTPAKSNNEDCDVTKENELVFDTPNETFFSNDNSVLLKKLTKYYRSFPAVKGVSLAIPRGECFGLLGVNGAGKTTTFKMLTGDENISYGEAYVNGHSVSRDMKQVHRVVGYCPQFDALLDLMTGLETIAMYCRLRGIPENRVNQIADKLSKNLLFTEHLNKLVKGYSGGTKRKLSTALALIGGPPILFLDEPTTGMDPVARRLLWDTINKIRQSGRTIVLTSHSMEECEVLCTRLAIMVDGVFACLGSPQHLKNKFGKGYTLIVKMQKLTTSGETWNHGSTVDTRTEQVRAFVRQTFPGAILKDEHQDLLQYYIPQTAAKWGTIFGIMERAKKQLNLDDYSVSQTTLEQVFINFAHRHHPEVPSVARA